MCCCAGITSCYGSGCGYCSECVGTAACNPTLCSSCISGAIFCVPVETPTPGSGTDIATNTYTSCTPIDVSACLPFAGTDANGNDIYQNPDGSLTYSDGSPATRADIACNCGACKCTPCSPGTCGASDTPPHASAASGPIGGGSGAGTAKPSAGGAKTGIPIGTANAGTCAISKLSSSMNKLGTSITSLLTGGTRTVAGAVLPGQTVQKTNTVLTPNSYLLVVLIVGALLLVLAFGHKPTPD